MTNDSNTSPEPMPPLAKACTEGGCLFGESTEKTEDGDFGEYPKISGPAPGSAGVNPQPAECTTGEGSTGEGSTAESACNPDPPLAHREDDDPLLDMTLFNEAMNHVVSVISHTFAFGYYEMDDIRQEARLMCMDAFSRWDRVRPLANFLYSHVHKRLYNLRRNKFMRNDAPCALCHGGHLHENGSTCEAYKKWLKINLSKKYLAQPGSHAHPLESNTEDRSAKCPSYRMEMAELFTVFDKEIPLSLRKDYLKMKEGAFLPKKKERAVIQALRKIAEEKGLL